MVQPAKSKVIRSKQVSVVKVLRAITVARRVGYIGAGGLGARERSLQRRPYADFFEYFLVRRQESIIVSLYFLCNIKYSLGYTKKSCP